VTLGSLPEDVLLEMFDIYINTVSDGVYVVESETPSQKWQKLAHVCRRWRCIVFASPLRLNLELRCTSATPVRKLLDIWPDFPLVIELIDIEERPSFPGDIIDDVIAALEHRDRVREIDLDAELTSSELERITTTMDEPFPVMTSLTLVSSDRVLRLPDTFLNGSAPSLRTLFLGGISFTSLPRLLSSASHLTSLFLDDLPNAGYISPESLATSLSALTNLNDLSIRFLSPTPQPRRRDRPLPSPIRILLPALTSLHFRGVSEYLEVFASRIDAPLLNHFVDITFFNQLVFDIPQISRLVLPHLLLSTPSSISLMFHSQRYVKISFKWQQEEPPVRLHLAWRILCKGFDWQVYSAAQICTHILPLLSESSVNSLDVKYFGSDEPIGIRSDDMDPTRWIELFNPFTSVQRLEIPGELEPFIAAALQGLTEESAAQVLPALQNLSIVRTTTDEVAQQGIQSFVTAREHSNHPFALSRSS
jgi:hypothetical protein